MEGVNMENVKNFVGKSLSVDGSITMTVPDESMRNENIFLIGLNFNGSEENGTGENSKYQVRNKIPMLMLKIDTDKILSVHSSEGKVTAEKKQPVKSEVNEYDNTGENLLREVYSVGYKTSENKLPHDNLSFRELQVMKLIALGKARKEIAEELFLSISTINTYRARILDKMNMKNNAEIMRYAFQHKFVE
jgi:DNA-binding CsgD family transcriptional regulator